MIGFERGKKDEINSRIINIDLNPRIKIQTLEYKLDKTF